MAPRSVAPLSTSTSPSSSSSTGGTAATPLRVVVVGCGYAGGLLVKALVSELAADVVITVVDQAAEVVPKHVKRGAVRAAVHGGRGWAERDRAQPRQVPLDKVFKAYASSAGGGAAPSVQTLVARAERVDPTAKLVILSSPHAPLPYDVLVAAIGSTGSRGDLPTHLLGRDEVRRYFDETASAIRDAADICIVGGSASAVEYASEIKASYAEKRVRVIAATAASSKAETLAGTELGQRKASFVQKEYAKLAGLGIEVVRGERVLWPQPQEFQGKRFIAGRALQVRTAASVYDADLVLYAGTWNPAVSIFPQEWLTDGGHLACRASFQLLDSDHVFAVGSACDLVGEDLCSSASMIQAIPAIARSIRRCLDSLSGSAGSLSPKTPSPLVSKSRASQDAFGSKSDAPLLDAAVSGQAPTEASLYEVLRRKDWTSALTLIKRRLGLGYVDPQYGMSPLHMAVTVNAPVRVVEALLESGCDPNQRDAIGNTAVHVGAGRNVDGAVLVTLLDAGGDPNLVNDDGLNAVGVAAKGNVGADQLHALLDAGGVAIRPRDKDGATPLWLAAAHNAAPRLAKMLIEAGADVDAAARDGTTPLLMACQRNASPALVRVLVESGASRTARSAAGVSVLSAALAARASADLLRALLDGDAGAALVNRREGAQKRTPLMTAVASGLTAEAVELLLSRGADVHAQDAEGKTAMDLMQGKRGVAADAVMRALTKAAAAAPAPPSALAARDASSSEMNVE